MLRSLRMNVANMSQMTGPPMISVADDLLQTQRMTIEDLIDVFVNKRMLFKIEVTDANLYRNWRGYTAKKVTDDENVINRFTSLHGINLSIDDEDANYDHLVCPLGDDTLLFRLQLAS